MADFTSTQTGNWDDGATWGNTSPGVAGTDFPGVSADTVTIAATHVVTYDSGDNEAVEYGDIVVSGTLTFPTNADSTLTMGTTNAIIINSGGSFLAGSSTTPIDATYQCKIIFRYTTTDRTCFDAKNGSTVEMYGDPDYYGDDFVADLDSDWTTGQTLYVTGDWTSWPTDGMFCIHKNTRYGSYATDIQFYTIASLTYDSGNNRTAIVINETAPGLSFYQYYYDGTNSYTGWNGKVWMVDRNIKMTTDSLTNGLDLTVDIDQTAGNNLKHFECVQFQGFEDCVSGVYNLWFNKCTVIHLEKFFNTSHNLTVTNCVVAKGYSSGHAFSGSIKEQTNNWILGCYYGLTSISGWGSNITHLIGNYNPVYNASQMIGPLNIVLVGTSKGATSTNGLRIRALVYGCVARFIDNSSYTTISFDGYDLQGLTYGSLSEVYLYGDIDNNGANCSVAHTGHAVWKGTLNGAFYISSMLYSGAFFAIESTIDGTYYNLWMGEDGGSLRSITNAATNWETPVSGNSWILEFNPNTGQLAEQPAYGFPRKWNSTPILATHTTVTFKVFSKTWTDPRINTAASSVLGIGLMFFISYPDGASDQTCIGQQSASQSLSNGAWTDITFTVAPGRDGILEWNFLVQDDENITILIDPIVVIS